VWPDSSPRKPDLSFRLAGKLSPYYFANVEIFAYNAFPYHDSLFVIAYDQPLVNLSFHPPRLEMCRIGLLAIGRGFFTR
jgi:hypothetical protein